MNHEYDILILGGGLVGSSLACALEGRGLRLGLVEASAPGRPAPGFDERKLALAAASINALGALGVLEHMDVGPSPVRAIHVSRAGDFGSVRLHAADYGRESFGGVVLARELGQGLERRLSSLADLRMLRPQTVTGVHGRDDGIELDLQGESGSRRVGCRLLVVADGTRSFARQALGIGTQEHDYGQTLLVCSVSCDRDAQGMAYERFTDQGPVALLPMGRDYGAICTVERSQAAQVIALDDAGYAAYFQQRFGWRAGRITRVGARSAYPLARVLAERITAARAVLVGNAAQTIHPIGAQGFNLGLRDALTLAESIEGGSLGEPEALAAYAASREQDRARTLAFSDGLARATANSGLPMQAARSLAMLALGNVPGLASGLVAGAMGFRGQVPALARADRP